MAYIKLSSKIRRRSYFQSRRGLIEDDHYTSWRVDATDSFNATIKKQTCRPFYRSFANPFSDHKYSPFTTVTDCDFVDGNTGAPLMDGNAVRGVLSSKMKSEISRSLERSGVLIEPTLKIQHVSNLACSVNPLTYYQPALKTECKKEITQRKLISIRKDMKVNSKYNQGIHRENMNSTLSGLNATKNFFEWDFDFFLNPNERDFESFLVKPRCLYNVNSWIENYKTRRNRYLSWVSEKVMFPSFKLNIKFDKYLRPVSSIQKLDDREIEVYFSPSGSKFRGKTKVFFKGLLFGKYEERTFESVTKNCSSR
mgnify:CR=1 FL=1